ncbi:hypothetical protein MPL3356_510001 [Mesorhizobium plurifarium]|uniref:Uncharacterized protein n=1 Tax=Mesorhizobium plurifarium TaxID=69974 RepID=A0A090G276_MESPL|nr:hypothetical protein MPL3356_510001 [Mesorhizobium plurifarium]
MTPASIRLCIRFFKSARSKLWLGLMTLGAMRIGRFFVFQRHHEAVFYGCNAGGYAARGILSLIRAVVGVSTDGTRAAYAGQ